ncbi:hypothetical protein ACHAXS_007846 [Conticribra weissflogii]
MRGPLCKTKRSQTIAVTEQAWSFPGIPFLDIFWPLFGPYGMFG